MARPSEFDRSEVVHRAMRVFWTHGFQATSVRALSKATGLQSGSLYAAFGSKDGLFLEALTAYGAQIRAAVAAEPPATLLEAWFDAHIDRSLGPADGPGRGCLLLLSAGEHFALSPECAQLVREELQELEHTFVSFVARARGDTTGGRRDESGPGLPGPVATARSLVAALAGISTLSRAGADRSVLEDVARVALASVCQRPTA